MYRSICRRVHRDSKHRISDTTIHLKKAKLNHWVHFLLEGAPKRETLWGFFRMSVMKVYRAGMPARAVSQHQLHLTPPPELPSASKPPWRSSRKWSCKSPVNFSAQSTDGQRQHPLRRCAEHGLIGIEPSPQPVGDGCRLPDGGTLEYPESRRRLGSPASGDTAATEAGVHQFVRCRILNRKRIAFAPVAVADDRRRTPPRRRRRYGVVKEARR